MLMWCDTSKGYWTVFSGYLSSDFFFFRNKTKMARYYSCVISVPCVFCRKTFSFSHFFTISFSHSTVILLPSETFNLILFSFEFVKCREFIICMEKYLDLENPSFWCDRKENVRSEWGMNEWTLITLRNELWRIPILKWCESGFLLRRFHYTNFISLTVVDQRRTMFFCRKFLNKIVFVLHSNEQNSFVNFRFFF